MNLAIVDLQEAVAAIDPVAGSDTQVQFNDSGNMGASSDFTFNKTTKVADVNGTILVKRLLAGGVH
jgi:fumarate hydratase class II